MLIFKSSAFGDEADRPLARADGTYTYFMPDIAYQYNKFERGFKKLVMVLGADHAGYVTRLKSAVNAVTQVLLNLSMNLFNVRPSDLLYCLVYFLLELAVFALEAALYCCLLRRLTDKPRRNRYYILYALVANAASLCIGLVISPMLPSVF